MQANALVGNGASIGGVGLGVRADGGLNLAQNTVGNNLLIGYRAGESLAATGVRNHLIGYQSGRSLTTGVRNHFIGFRSGSNTTTGSINHFEGYEAGRDNTTGSANYFSGYQVGLRSVDGDENTFVGNSAGWLLATGSGNTFVGYRAAAGSTSGSGNFALGSDVILANNLTNAGAIGAGARVAQSNSVVLGTLTTRVGIGVDAPQAALDVNGGVRLRGLATPGYVVSSGGAGDLAVVPPSAFETTTAANGLNLSGTAVRLGGALSQNTALEGGPYELTFRSAAGQAVVTDQQQLNTGATTGVNGTWQSFTAGQSGLLTSVEVRLNLTGAGSRSGLSVNVYAGTGTGGPLLASTLPAGYLGPGTYNPRSSCLPRPWWRPGRCIPSSWSKTSPPAPAGAPCRWPSAPPTPPARPAAAPPVTCAS